MPKNQGRTNAEVKAAVVAKLAAGTPISEIKSTAAGERLGGAAVREIAQNRGYIPVPVAPSPTATATPSTSAGRTTADLRQTIATKAAAGVPLSDLKASFAGEKLGGSTVQNIFQRNKQVASSSGTEAEKETETEKETDKPIEPVLDPNAIGITEPEFTAAQTAAELQTRSQISNYGWDAQKAIAALQQAGATERTKYEVDNKIPLAQAEAQGKIDLQKIVNAGYKNIANIERGTEMVRNITSMFNF